VDGEIMQSFRSEGLTYAAAYGVNGGGDGLGCEVSIESDGKRVNDLPQFGKRALINPKFTVSSAGGGGWGDPRRRDAALVARDVKDGIVSIGAARERYGVAIDAAGLVDPHLTARLRAVAAE
jgi:N-methylhydantoinase B